MNRSYRQSLQWYEKGIAGTRDIIQEATTMLSYSSYLFNDTVEYYNNNEIDCDDFSCKYKYANEKQIQELKDSLSDLQKNVEEFIKSNEKVRNTIEDKQQSERKK